MFSSSSSSSSSSSAIIRQRHQGPNNHPSRLKKRAGKGILLEKTKREQRRRIVIGYWVIWREVCCLFVRVMASPGESMRWSKFAPGKRSRDGFSLTHTTWEERHKDESCNCKKLCKKKGAVEVEEEKKLFHTHTHTRDLWQMIPGQKFSCPFPYQRSSCCCCRCRRRRGSLACPRAATRC